MNNFWTHNFKYFLFGSIGIVIFLMWKGCGNKEQTALIKELEGRLIEKDSVISASKTREQRLENNILERTTERDSVQLIADYRLTQINNVKPRVIRLAGEVLIKTDSLKCDSLANFANDLIWLIDDYVNQQVITQIKTDSIETDLRGVIKEKEQQIDVLTKTLDFATDKVIPAIKRKPEIYLGADVIGNKTTIFSGYGANVNLLTTKGQIYTVGTSWINGEQFYSAGVKVRLSFKRH